MKKKLFFGFLALTTAGILTTSCSESEEEKTNNPITNPSNPSNPGNGDNTTNSVKYQHKVLLEDITGTWCPNCPPASSAIAQAKSNSSNGSNIIAAAFHIGQSNYPDPMQINDGVNVYRNFFVPNYGEDGVFSFPTIVINRADETWNRQGISQFFNSINQQGSKVGIKIASNLTNTGGTISASFTFSEGYQNLRYGIYVLEHDVKTSSAQAGTNGATGGTNYVHKDVVRAVPSGVNHLEIGAITAGQEINKTAQTTSYTLFNDDLDKVEVVVFVTDANGKVLNVQSAKANETVNYQKLN